MKIHGTKEGVDIGYSQRKNGGRQRTVFKENWSTGKMEPVQSKNSQAISGADDSYYQKKRVLWTLSMPFPFRIINGLRICQF